MPTARTNIAASHLLLYYQNVGGINSSLAEYQLACNDECYDIYAFTETWFNDNTLSTQLFNDTYAVYRHDRSSSNSTKRSGGGVLLAARSCFKSRLIEPPENSNVEQLWVAITAQDTTLYICVVYIPPDRVNDSYLIEKHLLSLDWIVSQMGAKDNIIILGDFNLRDTVWSFDSRGFGFPDASLSATRPTSSNLLDAYCTAGLKQLNRVPNSNDRMLDLCFVSVDIGSDCMISQAPSSLVKDCRHHPPLMMTLKVCHENAFKDITESISYDFCNANFNDMNIFLMSIDWVDTLHDLDFNQAASTVSNILFYGIDQFVPKRLSRKPVKPAWSNSQLKRLKQIKRAALRKHSKHRTTSTKEDYLKANREYKQLNNRLYRGHQSQLQRRLKTHPKNFWRFINDQRKESGLPFHMTNGVEDADTIPDIANLFRAQFGSVFTNEHLNAQDIIAATSNVHRMPTTGHQLSITRDMVISAGKQLKSSTGSGPDGIPSVVLKRCISTLATPLEIVFNLSLRSGVFPTCWKDSYVFPVFKKGCKRSVLNYRGIAALCATSKLFELIVLESLVQRLAQSISQDQHGFMPKRSTSTNLTTFTSYIIREIERGHQVDAIYTDLSAAFDKLNHEIALAKYDAMGIENHMLTWLRSYLVGRSMSVRIGDYNSSPFPATSGVPQGSHLGPFLFLLYMNDIHTILKCLKLSYADDLKLYFVINDQKDAIFLQQQLEIFANWCATNRMSLNVSKCSVISFGRKRSLYCHPYSLSGTELKRESTVKDLGMLLDTKLTFKDHISYAVSKASSQLGFIFRFAKNFKDVYCLKSLYCSLVRPILEYASVVWSPYYQNEIKRIEAIQRRFIRFALRHLPWRDPFHLPSYESRCKLVNLELLEQRRNVAKACFVGDLLQANIDCSALLGLLDINVRHRNLRSQAFLSSRVSRTNYGKNEPVRSMCRIFNRCYHVFDFNVSRVVNRNNFRSFLC